MKQFFTLLSLLLVMGMSANVMAQSTGTGVAPHIGETHTYTVDAHGTNTFEWLVTEDANGTGTNLLTAGAIVSGDGSTDNNINLTWTNPTVGSTYFVHVIETANGTTCVNRKALAVTPANAFALEIVSVDVADADADNGQDATLCPPDVAVDSYANAAGVEGSLTRAQDFVYDFDATILYYKITASGINTTNTGWSPQFTIGTTNEGDATITAEWATSIGGSYTELTNIDGSTANDINVPDNNPSIWVKVTIDNGNSTSGLEGTTAQNVTVTLLDAENTSEDENGNDVTDLGNVSRKQIVSARPATSVITTTE